MAGGRFTSFLCWGSFAAAATLAATAADAPGNVPQCVLTGELVDRDRSRTLSGEVLVFEVEDDAARIARRLSGRYHVEPLARASVTGSRFRVAVPAGAGSVRVLAHAGGNRSLGTQVVPRRAGVQVVDPWVERTIGIEGRVMTTDGKPLQASISSGDVDVTADAQGRFRIEGVTPGCYVWVRLRGFATQRLKVEPGTKRLDLRMRPGAALAGSVRDVEGRPVGGALVEASEDPEGILVMTDASGCFQLEDLGGPLTLLARSDVHAPTMWKGTVPLAKGMPSPAFVLSRGASLEIDVVDRVTGKPVAGALCTMEPDVRRFTGTGGVVRFGGLLPMAGFVSVEAPGYASATTGEITIRAAESRVIPLALERAAGIAGTVVDEDGRPVDGAFVSASEGRLAWWDDDRTRTDGGGHFSLEAPLHARMLVVERQGFVRKETAIGSLPPGEMRDAFRIELARGATVTGRAVDASGNPIEGADVAMSMDRTLASLGLISNSGAPGATTGADGTFRIAGLECRRCEVTVSHAGFVSSFVKLDVKVGQAADAGDVTLVTGETIRGAVRDARGNGIGGATARLGLADTESSADGTFELTGLSPARDAEVSVHASGYRATSVVASTGDGHVAVVLERSATVRGTVTDRATGRPVPSFEITAGSGSVPHAFRAPDGSFELDDLEPGAVELVVKVPGFLPSAPRTVEIQRESETSPVEIAVDLVRGLEVSGTVTDRAGDPVAGATIELAASESDLDFAHLLHLGNRTMETISDAAGRFALEAVAAGSHVVRVSATRRADWVKALFVESDMDLAVVLEPAFKVTGYVQDDSGSPVAGAEVRMAVYVLSNPPEAVTLSGADGSFELEAASSGDHALAATADTRKSDVAHVTLGGGDAPSVTLVVSVGCRIGGTILGLDPAAFAETSVRLRHGPQEWTEATIDATGHFETTGLSSGSWTIEARQGGRRAERAVSVTPLQPATVELDLSGGASRLEGLVTQREGVPEGAMVTVESDDGSTWSAEVDGAGRYEIAGLRDGDHDLRVWSGGESFGMGRISIDGATQRDLEIPVQHDVTIHVVDGTTRRSLQGVRVSLDSAESDHDAWGQTNDAGDARLEGVVEGTYTLTAERDGHGRILRMVELGAAADIVVEMEKDEMLTLLVTDERTGVPPLAVSAAPIDSATASSVNPALCAAREGGFVVPGLAEGRVDLLVVADGSPAVVLRGIDVPGEARLFVGAGGSIELRRGTWTTATLHAADGSEVWLSRGSWFTHKIWLTWGQDGIVTLGPVAPGSYTLRLTRGDDSADVPVVVRAGEIAAVMAPG